MQSVEDLLKEFCADPEGYEINKTIGLKMLTLRKYKQRAELHIKMALAHGREDEQTPHLMDAMGMIHSTAGRFKEAADIYAQCCKKYPRMGGFPFRYGHALLRLGRINEASEIFRAKTNRLYEQAKHSSQEKGEPVVHVLEPSNIICLFFGELAAKLDLYLKVRELGYAEAETPVLYAPKGSVSNQCLLDYWGKRITVIKDADEIARHQAEYPANTVLLDYFTVPGGMTLHRDLAHRAFHNLWEDEGRPPLLKLDDAHREKGWDVLRKHGVPEGAWFAPLHVRESGFFDEDVEWSGNFLRNAHIETYFPAIREITGRGGWVLRLGDASMAPLPEMDRVIDYAHSDFKSDWMDIFLIAEGRFYFGMASGPSSAAVAFGTPTLGTNWFHLGPWPYCSGDIFIHKLLRSVEDGRILSIAESLAPTLFGALEPLFFEKIGLEALDNTPEEILEATREMLDGLEGKLVYSKDDERTQAAFRRQADPYGIEIRSRAARGFLERHPELIEET